MTKRKYQEEVQPWEIMRNVFPIDPILKTAEFGPLGKFMK